MDLRLKGRVAVVTGGASGIGLACAREFAREGCSVALWDISPQGGEAATAIAEDFDIQTLALRVDVSDAVSVTRAVAETEAKLGPVSHLVHAAAVGSGKFGFPFTNLEPADWARVLEVNISGMVNVAHAVSDGMTQRNDGTMVFIGSIAGQIGSQTDPPYSASKAAGINFAQCLAKDLAPHNVRVNTVNPGMVRTRLNRGVWQSWNEQQAPASRLTYEEWGDQKVRAVAPLARWQETQDIADMVVFLSSARARQVTGQSVNVDGGQVMHS